LIELLLPFEPRLKDAPEEMEKNGLLDLLLCLLYEQPLSTEVRIAAEVYLPTNWTDASCIRHSESWIFFPSDCTRHRQGAIGFGGLGRGAAEPAQDEGTRRADAGNQAERLCGGAITGAGIWRAIDVHLALVVN
jgi:hypothetical protein